MTTNRLWVLGASDPEMELIEALLRGFGESVSYALNKDGERVSPPEAYDAHVPLEHLGSRTELFWVECAPKVFPEGFKHKVMDHHRPGDPGYGRPAEEFLPASSIGQVMDWLVLNGFITTLWVDDNLMLYRECRLAAAADHCLLDAYRGRCPGIDPDELMKWRVRTRAKFQGRSEEEILRDVENARLLLRNSPARYVVDIGQFVDLTDAGFVPELPEAAAREGLAFVAKVKDKTGEKLVLQCAPPELVKWWIEDQRGLGRKVYGDPARGFAGAYLTANR